VSERQHNRPGANYRAPLPEVGVPGGRQSQAVGLRPGLPAETAWRANPSCAAIGFSRWRAGRLPVHHWAQKASPRQAKVWMGWTIPLWPRD
jgi:hypothetical protein